jgi:hypothetical protein
MNLSVACSSACACPWSACPKGSPDDDRRMSGLHHHHAGGRPGSWQHRERADDAQPAGTACLAELMLHVVRVGHRANGCHALCREHGAARPTFRRSDRVTLVAADELGDRRRPSGRSDRPCPASSRCCARSCRPACAEAASHCPASRQRFHRRQRCRRRPDAAAPGCSSARRLHNVISAMNAVRFGSYSRRSTVAGTSNLRRLKSTKR